MKFYVFMNAFQNTIFCLSILLLSSDTCGFFLFSFQRYSLLPPISYKSLSSSHFLRPPIVHTDLHLHLIENSLAITSFQSSFPSLNILLAHSMQSKPAWRLDRPGNETNLAVHHYLHYCAFTVLTKYSSPWQQVSL